MTFKNEKELKNFLLKKCKNAISNTQKQSAQEVKCRVGGFYDDYTPERYNRTGQLDPMQNPDFLVVSDIKTTVGGCEGSVELNPSALNYYDGNQPSGEQVMAAASQGLHGAIGSEFLYVAGDNGVKIWDGQLQAEANKTLVQELKSQGIPIK